jgi:hypothetical protein
MYKGTFIMCVETYVEKCKPAFMYPWFSAHVCKWKFV